jgi:hypothetical protein
MFDLLNLSQFAYNETSFFLIRLLQNFSGITLASDTSQPPPNWAKSAGYRDGEKVWPKSHLTTYVRVSFSINVGRLLLII